MELSGEFVLQSWYHDNREEGFLPSSHGAPLLHCAFSSPHSCSLESSEARQPHDPENQ